MLCIMILFLSAASNLFKYWVHFNCCAYIEGHGQSSTTLGKDAWKPSIELKMRMTKMTKTRIEMTIRE